jgi:hypothetical protein
MITKNYVIKYNDPRHPDLRFRFAETIELPIFVAFNDHGSPPPKNPSQKTWIFLSIAKAMAYHHAEACILSP